jgi:hypothetical protein
VINRSPPKTVNGYNDASEALAYWPEKVRFQATISTSRERANKLSISTVEYDF